MRVVNLSSRPFVNERPVVRLSMALWVLAAVLAAYNIYAYSTYWLDSEEIRGEVADVRDAIDREQEDLAELSQKASAVDVESLNDHALFLNNLIRYRTFPWSRLFGDLEDVLPKNVRLVSVRPVVDRQEDVERTRRRPRTSRASRRSSRDAPPEPVAAPPPVTTQEIPMTLAGYAKSDEEILDFVDILFAHPSFQDPDFKRESLSEDLGEVAFDIDVVYLLDLTEVDAGAGVDLAESDETPASPGGGSEGARQSSAEAPQDAEAVVRIFSGEETSAAAPEPSRSDLVPRARALDERVEEADLQRPDRLSPPPPSIDTRRLGAVRRDEARPAEARPAEARPAEARPAEARPAEARPAETGSRIGGVPITVLPPQGTPPAAGASPDPTVPPSPSQTRPRRITPTRPDPPRPADARDSEGLDQPDSSDRPRFVEPNASGTTPIFPGGGS